MSREVLAVDVDEVFFPMAQNFLDDYNAQNGTQHSLADFKTYRFEHDLGLSIKQTVKEVFGWIGTGNHLHIQPLEGSIEAVDKITSQYDVEVITARDSMFRSVTTDWLSAKFGQVFKDIHFVGYSPIMEVPVSKAEICQKIGAFAMIDDSISHLVECAEVGIDGILFGDYPWNQVKELPSGLTRCRDWQVVAEYLNV